MKALLLQVSLLLYLCTSAQVYRNELALDIAPLIKGEKDLGFIYRHAGSKGSLRLAFSYALDTKDEDESAVNKSVFTTTMGTETRSNAQQANLRIGWQRNINVSDSWLFYAGADAYAHLESSNSNESVNTPGSFGSTRQESQSDALTLLYGISPVLGFTYQFNTRFCVSFESGVFIGRRYIDNSSATRYYFYDKQGHETLNNTISTSTSGDGWKLDLSPASQFRCYLGYRF